MTSFLSPDQIINYGIGRDLLNQFMTWEIVGTKKDGDHWYTVNTMDPPYSKTEWNEAVEEGDDYSINNEVYTYGEFWGDSVEMQKNENSKTKKHNFGSLFYNVPNSNAVASVDTVTQNYVISGEQLTGLDGNDYSVKLFVPISSNIFSETASSSPYQYPFNQTIQPGDQLTITNEQGFATSSSSTTTRSFGVNASITYKLKASIEDSDVEVKESVDASLEEALELNFAKTKSQTKSNDSSTSTETTQTFSNNSTNSYQLVAAVPYNSSTSQYNILGKLGSIEDSDPKEDESIVQYYIQKNGQKKYTSTVQKTIYDALTYAQEKMGDASLANSIDPTTGEIATTGTFESTAATNAVYFWFYDPDNNCYASTWENEDDCKCDQNANAGVTATDECADDNSTNTLPSNRYARNQKPDFNGELFSLSSLKRMHKTKPLVKDSTLLEKDGVSLDAPVGSMAETYFGAYAIGGNVHDWHTNKTQGEHGGSILHGGPDQYYGNSGRDFVSSKSFGGASTIDTKAGQDTVLIDTKKASKFTPGHTFLGKGNDTILYKGSDKDLTTTGTKHEFLSTGKGRDEIIASKNVKLHIDDFNLEKDTLEIDFDRYQSRIAGNSIIFSNDEGGSIILRNVLSDFNGSIDDLPFT